MMTVIQYKDAMKSKASENTVQTWVCSYLRKKYPDVNFRTDKDGQFARGATLKYKAEHKGRKGFPDIVIAEKNKSYNGLIIELKKGTEKVFKRDGTLRKDDHLADQAFWLEWFRSLGCKAEFAIGYDEAIKLIDEYLQNR